MRFDEWEPLYLQIINDFGFSRDHDEDAAKLLSDLLNSNRTSSTILAKTLELAREKSVIVCGNSHSLEKELENIIPSAKGYIFIAADGATSTLLRAGLAPDIIVSDLDGVMEDILQANEKGSIIVVHAHGDNQDKLKEYVPKLKNIIGTTQSKPIPGLYNFGGFTDGDRAVFLARRLGAQRIELIGFDFEDESVTFRKRKKLNWAKRLIDLALSEERYQGSNPEGNP